MKPIFVTCALMFGLLAVFAVVRAAEDKPAAAKPGVQESGTLDRTIRLKMQYLIYLPDEYDEKESWPLLVFLHGAGERGDNLQKVKIHGPPKLIDGGKKFPFIVASPQCPAEEWWQSQQLSALVDDLVEKYKVDEDRIYITGLSMGGFGTWGLASYEPHRYAAIAPICGGGEAYRTRRFPHLPVWAFHGAKDFVVPLERSQMMIDALKKHGGKPKFTVYPEAEHDSWTETYENPELYEWLLSQKRQKPADEN